MPDSEFNPYAAPRSNSTSLTKPEVPLERPTSTKWLLGLQWILVAYLIASQLVQYLEQGIIPFSTFDTPRAVLGLAMFFSILLAFHVLKRSRAIYILGIVYLVLLNYISLIQSLRTLLNISSQWNSQTEHSEKMGELIAATTLPLLLIWLLIRFTFGKPSRLFYRIARD